MDHDPAFADGDPETTSQCRRCGQPVRFDIDTGLYRDDNESATCPGEQLAIWEDS